MADPDDLGAAREEPLLIVVTGPPGAGKTKIAALLARALCVPLVARDDLKETLYDELGTGDVEWTRRLGGASFALLFVVAGRLLDAGSSLVLEANFFRGTSENAFAELPPHRSVQVHCTAPVEVLLARVTNRPDRHPGHIDHERLEELTDRLRTDAHEPLDLPGRVIRVDTSRDLDLSELAARIGSSP